MISKESPVTEFRQGFFYRYILTVSYTNIQHKKRFKTMNILSIFAHPDDESFGPGGTLAMLASNQHRTGLVTLTRGEAGSLGISKELGPDELARRRSEELKCSANFLGINYLSIYDLPDKKLSEIPVEVGLEIIKKEIEKFIPEMVITFHPNGISGHKDHITVTNWIIQILNEMENPPKLFYYGLVPEQTELYSHRKLHPMASSEVTHKIDTAHFFDQKIRAIECHKTQEELWKSLQSSPKSFEEMSRWEYFSRAIPQPVSKEIKFQFE
jgi:LmbE family N-acetylglucosaminyl deacetylase